ncbi:MAG: LamG domain-containing protein [Anaerolineales bacterium]|nr:LamG domain-containing protein [Anaerolineales bacterium]MCW5856026.1 LamG domain-containing protein [Anaerolineales bacterium]
MKQSNHQTRNPGIWTARLLVASVLVATLAYAVFGLLATPAAASGLPAAGQPPAWMLPGAALQEETDTPTPADTPTASETLTPSETLTASQTPSPSHTPSPSATATPTANLLARWSFDEGSGSTAGDTHGAQNNNGTISGATWTDYGLSGKALLFDGSNDYVSVADSADLKPANGFSVGGWIYPLSVGGSVKTIVIKSTAQDYILRTTADGYLEFWAHDLNPKNVTGPVPPLNTWTHVMGVYDKPANQIRLYVNGVLVAAQTVTGTAAYDTGALRIGANHSAAQAWHGRLDEITLWDRALSDAEIAGFYAAVQTPTPTPSQVSTLTPTPMPTLTELQQRWGTGADGDVEFSGTVNISTTATISGRTCADSPNYRVTALTGTQATLNSTPAGDCLKPGDEILLINIGSQNTNLVNVGNYEFLRVHSVAGNVVTFVDPKGKFYGETTNQDNNLSSTQYVHIQRVPNYHDVELNGLLNTTAMNYSTSTGIVVFRVQGELTGTGTLNVSQRGYPGGPASSQGRGIRYTVSTSNQANYGGGGSGNGGTYTGGGGAYGTSGGAGSSWVATGGGPYGLADLSKIYHGSGGGGGGSTGQNSTGGVGGRGGGIILIHAFNVNFNGTIQANGQNGQNGSGPWWGAGGGGAGGSISITGFDLNLNSTTITATGGGVGGAGGKGRIAFFYQNSHSINSSNPSATPVQIYVESTATPTPTLSLTPTATGTLTAPGEWGNGLDGDVVINNGQTVNLNSATLIAGRSCADGGDAVAYSVLELTSHTAKLQKVVSDGCLSPGDKVLIINLQGTSANSVNVGNYEALLVSNVVGDTVVFTTAKQNFYGNGAGNDNNLGIATNNQRVMLMRIPQYRNLTVNGTLTVSAWNGVRVGVLAFEVQEMLNGTGSMQVNALGYRGGPGGYFNNNRNGRQGESYTGVGGISVQANGGGGGGGPVPWEEGAGGNHAGGAGGTSHAYVGSAYGNPQLSKLYFGSGGGGGGAAGSGESTGGNGAPGGGIIFVRAQEIAFTGSIQTRGQQGSYGSYDWVNEPGYGESGGGAGGSIRIEGDIVDLNSLSAAGGAGGNNNGGPGGNGRIAIYYQTSLDYASSSPAIGYTGMPGTPTPTPTPTDTPTPPAPVGWQNWEYSYGSQQPHAPSGVIYATPTP